MKQVLMLMMAFGLYGATHAQIPELMYYQFNQPSQSVINHAKNPVGANPAIINGNIKTGPDGFLNSRALSGQGDLSGANHVITGWNTKINGSFTLAFWTKDVPISNTLYYIFGDQAAGEFRCFTNGVAGTNNWMVRGGELPDLPIVGAAGSAAAMVHIVYDSAAATYTSYVNGVLNTQVVVDSVPNVLGGGLKIGGYINNFGLMGKLDEFRWYNRALSQTEISNTYNIDLNIKGNCPPFSNFRIDTVMATSAMISWTPAATNSAFYLEFGPEGFKQGTGNLITGVYPGSMPPVFIPGLQPKTTYEVYFGEICGGGDSAYLPNPVKFTTTRLCESPANLQVSNVTPYDAQVSWNHAGTTSNHLVIYGFKGFDPSKGGQTVSTTNQLQILTALSPATRYDVYLASNCGGSKGISDTIGPIDFTTQCAPVTAYPYVQDFETTLPGSIAVIPQCWSVNSPGDLSWEINRGITPSVNTGPAVDHTTDSIFGTYMYLETSLAGVPSELYTPEFDLTSLSSPVISFWYHMFGATMGELELQVTINGGVGWQTIARITGEQQYGSGDQWKYLMVDIAPFITNNTSFRFIGKRGGSFTGDMAVDDIEVRQGPACMAPSVFLSSATDSSASFNLIGGGTTYHIEWGPSGFAPGSGCKSIISNGPFTIDNYTDTSCTQFLVGNSDYDLYVRNECDSNSILVHFTTQCAGYYAPYSNNFDTESPYEIPSCWQVLYGGSSVGSGTAEVTNFGTGVTAPHHLRLYNGAGEKTSDTTLLISPRFEDLTGKDKQVTFSARAAIAGSYVIVGTLSDPNLAGSFTAIDTIFVQSNYQNYVVSLSGPTYNGTDKYVGILHGNFQSFSTIYIDDFVYEKEPSCIPPLLAGISVDDVSINSADISWAAGGPVIETHIAWGTPGFIPGTPGSGRGAVAGTVDSYKIMGLSPNTTYDIYIRDSCSLDNNSIWVGPIKITTDCNPVSAPLFENFNSASWIPGPSSSENDSISNCWSRNPGIDGSYKWGVFNAQTPSVSTGPSADHSGNGNYLYTEASSGTLGDQAFLYTPWVDLSALSRPYFSFFYHRFGNQLGDLLVEARDLSAVWDTLILLNTEDHSSESDAYLEIGARLMNLGDTVQIRFSAVSKGCCAGDMAIDDVRIDEAPTCPRIANLRVDGVSDTSAVVLWDSSADASSYQLWIGHPGGFVNGSPNGGHLISLNTLQYVLDTLPKESCFQVNIRSICAVGDTGEWAGLVDFCTLCDAQMAPHYQTFDHLQAAMAGKLGDCWSTLNIDLLGFGWRTHSGPTLSSNTGPMTDATGNGGNYIYTEGSSGAAGDEAILYSARLDLSALSQPELRFAYFMYGVDIDTLHIDVRDDNGWHIDALTLGGQQQYFDSDPWLDTTMSLMPYSGIVQVRFRTYRGLNYKCDLALDDIEIADPTSCPEPTALDTGLVTMNSATLTWNGALNGTYEIAYGQALASAQLGTRAVVIGNNYSLTGLNGGNQYGFFVRKICGPRDSSNWVGPFYFYTECVPLIAAPYYSNFEGISIGQQSAYENCWTTSGPGALSWESEIATGANQNTVSTGPYLDNTTYPVPGGTYMFLESSASGTYAELMSPAIDAMSIQNPELVYHYHMYGLDINKLEVYLEAVSNGARYLVDSIIGQQQIDGTMPFWERRIDIGNLPITSYKVIFRAYRGASYKGDISIDDMWVDELGSNSCNNPTALAATSVGCDSITVDWTSLLNSGYLEYGPVGFKEGSGVIIANVSAPYTITGLSPSTTYDVLATNVCGTDTSGSTRLSNIITLSAPKPVAVINYTDSVFNSKYHGAKFFEFTAVNSTNANSYFWDFGNGQTDSTANATAYYVYNQEYTVTLVVTNGCGSDTARIKVNINIDVEETPLSRSLSIYPNPAKNKVNLSFATSKDGEATIRILDVAGKEIMSRHEKGINGIFKDEMDISKLSGGVYLLEVDDGEFQVTHKLIKR